MKKKIISAVLLTIILLFGGCAENTNKLPYTESNTNSTEASVVYESEKETVKENSTEKAEKITASSTTQTVPEKVNKTTTKEQKTDKSEKTTSGNVCYITIICESINKNINEFNESKKIFLPKSGVILKETSVEINGNETVFDVIKKACKENTCSDKCKFCKASGIQIEYTYTPAFDNYYIEGIHQIYEKDCGMQSGWMYSVNGEFPNVGVSSYKVKKGDKIVFAYTCDMGEDIGNTY